MTSYARQRATIEHRFTALADYIWKLPDFINDQRARELKKLDAYFPIGDDDEDTKHRRMVRSWREAHEFGRLENDFPDFMASACFIHMVSLFEFHLSVLKRTIEQAGAMPFREARARRRGIAALLNYVNAACDGRLPDTDIHLFGRIAIIRHCLVHADGVLEGFGQAAEIRDIVERRLCYTPERTGGARPDLRTDHEPLIVEGIFGERLRVPTVFTHWLTAMARNLLMSACVILDEKSMA